MIFVGCRLRGLDERGAVAATTKAGLGRLVGVGRKTVERALRDKTLVEGGNSTWEVFEVELVKLERGRFEKGGKIGVKAHG